MRAGLACRPLPLSPSVGQQPYRTEVSGYRIPPCIRAWASLQAKNRHNPHNSSRLPDRADPRPPARFMRRPAPGSGHPVTPTPWRSGGRSACGASPFLSARAIPRSARQERRCSCIDRECLVHSFDSYGELSRFFVHFLRKPNPGVQKAATVGRGQRGWRMIAWPKATKSKSCRQKTRLSPRTCTCPTGSRSEQGRQEVIRDDEARKND